MLKIFRSPKKAPPEKGVSAALPSESQDSTTPNAPLALSEEDCTDKATAVLTNFMETIFKEGAHSWSPEEREKRIDTCLAEVASIQREEDKQDINYTSRKLRQQIQTGEFDSPLLNGQTTTHPAVAPGRPQPNMRVAIKKLAERIDFH